LRIIVVKQNALSVNPKVFISYSWDNKIHEDWVLIFAQRLLNNGVDVILDRYEIRLGNDLHHFMENSISVSDRVILILTPNYKLKAESRTGGTGHEYSVINTEFSKNRIDNKKFIPVLRSGTMDESVPINFRANLLLDMRSKNDFDEKFEELLRNIFEEFAIMKPHLGQKPNFTISNESTEKKCILNITRKIKDYFFKEAIVVLLNKKKIGIIGEERIGTYEVENGNHILSIECHIPPFNDPMGYSNDGHIYKHAINISCNPGYLYEYECGYYGNSWKGVTFEIKPLKTIAI
jgi:TIR domain